MQLWRTEVPWLSVGVSEEHRNGCIIGNHSHQRIG
jgi:hypothetical protein